MKRKIISICLFIIMVATSIPYIPASAASFSYTVSSSYQNSRFYTNFSSLKLSGNQKNDILLVAYSQLGYHEGNDDSDYSGYNNNGSKDFAEFNRLYGKLDNNQGNGVSYGYSWCCSFATWCAVQAGILSSVIKNEVSCYRLLNWFNDKGQYNKRANHTPKTGDFIFFINGSSQVTNHVGIVRYSTGTSVYTIEGNYSNRVTLNSYSLNDSKILGYASPSYTNNGQYADIDFSTFNNSYIITASSLNVRSDPNASSNIIDGLLKDTSVNVLSVSKTDCNWAEIEYGNGKHGYINLKYAVFSPVLTKKVVIKPWELNEDGYYYGASLDGTNPTKAEGVVCRGIDISKHNGVMDWDKIYKQYKDGTISFVIIRCGYGNNIESNDDIKWKANADACTRLGIPFGAYLFSYAQNLNDAKSEAEHALRLIDGYNLSYPIYYDVEWSEGQSGLGGDMFSQMCDIFCGAMLEAGYETGIYSMRSWITNNNYLGKVDYINKHYSLWIAEYNPMLKYDKQFDMWQCTSNAVIEGNGGSCCDVSFSYIPKRTADHTYITFSVGSYKVTQPAPQHGEYGYAIGNLPSLPSLNNKKFLGWSLSENEIKLVNSDYLIDQRGKLKLYAVYDDIDIKINSAYLQLDDGIDIVFLTTLPENAENVQLNITTAEESYIVSDFTYNGSYSKFVFTDFLPENIGDSFNATLSADVNGSRYSFTINDYSIKKYCTDMLGKAQSSPSLKRLLYDILIYGEKCQLYRDYKTDKLVTKGLTVPAGSYSFPDSQKNVKSISGDRSSAYYWQGASLKLHDRISAVFYFHADNTDNLTINVKINNRVMKFTKSDFVKNGDSYYIVFNDIYATEFNDSVICEFYVNDVNVGSQLIYSINSYIYSMKDTNEKELQDLLLAIYNYGISAYQYSKEI